LGNPWKEIAMSIRLGLLALMLLCMPAHSETDNTLPAQAQSVIPNGEYPLEIPPGLLSKPVPPGMTICFCLQQKPGGSPLHEKSDGSLYQEKSGGSLYVKMAHCKIETMVPTCLGPPDRENALSVISEMQRRTPPRFIMREGNNASLE
jgi:hypothetical protein